MRTRLYKLNWVLHINYILRPGPVCRPLLLGQYILLQALWAEPFSRVDRSCLMPKCRGRQALSPEMMFSQRLAVCKRPCLGWESAVWQCSPGVQVETRLQWTPWIHLASSSAPAWFPPHTCRLQEISLDHCTAVPVAGSASRDTKPQTIY